MTSRAGLTLVEVLIAAAVMSVCLSAAFLAFHMSDKSRGVAAAAEALRTALIIQEQIQTDLGMLVKVKDGFVHYWTDKPGRLAFYVSDPKQSTGTTVALHAVRYSLDGPPAYLKREFDAREEQVGTTPLNAITFAPFSGPSGPLVRVTLSVGRGPTDPPGPPVPHSFLARIPAPRGSEPLDLKVLSGFLNPADDNSESADLPIVK